ncbi:auxin-responsive family protein, partial [Genlisea aurea]
IPRGFVAVTVGRSAEEEQQQRFVIPVAYLNHPLFLQLLEEAEEEYGFSQRGPINIPCLVERFRSVSGLIDLETTSHHHHHHHHHNDLRRQHHHPHFLCFNA